MTIKPKVFAINTSHTLVKDTARKKKTKRFSVWSDHLIYQSVGVRIIICSTKKKKHSTFLILLGPRATNGFHTLCNIFGGLFGSSRSSPQVCKCHGIVIIRDSSCTLWSFTNSKLLGFFLFRFCTDTPGQQMTGETKNNFYAPFFTNVVLF